MKKYYLINKENTIKYSPLVNADNSQEGGIRFLRRRKNTGILDKESHETEKSLRKSQKELSKLEAKHRKYEEEKHRIAVKAYHRDVQRREGKKNRLENARDKLDWLRVEYKQYKQDQIKEKKDDLHHKHTQIEKIHQEKKAQIEAAKNKLRTLQQKHELEKTDIKSKYTSDKERNKEVKKLKEIHKKQERSLAMIEAKAIKHGYGSDKHMEAIVNRANKLKAKTRFRKSSTIKNEIYKDYHASRAEEFRLRAKRFFHLITFQKFGSISSINDRLEKQKKKTKESLSKARDPNDKSRQAILKAYHDKKQEEYLKHYKSKGLDHDSALLAASAATSLKMGKYYQEHQEAEKRNKPSHPHPQHQQHDNIPPEHQQKMKSVVGALEQRNLSDPDHVPSVRPRSNAVHAPHPHPQPPHPQHQQHDNIPPEHQQKMKSVVGALEQRNLSDPDHVPSVRPLSNAVHAPHPHPQQRPHPQHQQHDNIPPEHQQKMKSVVGALEQRNLSDPDHVPSVRPLSNAVHAPHPHPQQHPHPQHQKPDYVSTTGIQQSAPDHVPSTAPSRAAGPITPVHAAAAAPTTARAASVPSRTDAVAPTFSSDDKKRWYDLQSGIRDLRAQESSLKM